MLDWDKPLAKQPVRDKPAEPKRVPVHVFEIDLARYRERHLVTHQREIQRYVKAVHEKCHLVSLYLDDGSVFFLTSIIALDDDARTVLLDPPGAEHLRAALAAKRLTVSCLLGQVKIQFRLSGVSMTAHGGKPALMAPMPQELLRLQRRDFFRIDTPLTRPWRCRMFRQQDQERVLFAELPLRDISGGGLCLAGPIDLAERFALGEIFSGCQLAIPDEEVFDIHLRITEISRFETSSGDWQMRLGCEFIHLSRMRQGLIETYVTRLERERIARGGLLP